MNEQNMEKQLVEVSLNPDIPESFESDKVDQAKRWKIVKDERDQNGNGYIEVLIVASPVRTVSEKHDYKIGYQVSEKEGGTPGKKWQKVYEEDLGPVPITEKIQ